jgi:hypothetical protein
MNEKADSTGFPSSLDNNDFPVMLDKAFQHNAILISVSQIVVLALVILSFTVLLILGSNPLNTLGMLMAIAILAPFMYLASSNAAACIVLFSDITLEERGIRLHLLGPRSLLIPWEALRDATMSKIRAPDPDGRGRAFWQPRSYIELYVVNVPGLTFLHRLAGRHYRIGYPVFIVTPYHHRYETLLQRLRQAAIEQGCNPEWL